MTRFFDLNETWLAGVLEQGARGGRKQARPAIETARIMVATLEGAMMLARSYGDVERFERAGQRLLDDIIDARPAGARASAD